MLNKSSEIKSNSDDLIVKNDNNVIQLLKLNISIIFKSINY